MDPNACYERLIAALDEGDIPEAKEAARDLQAWITRGGFEPKWTRKQREAFYRFVQE